MIATIKTPFPIVTIISLYKFLLSRMEGATIVLYRMLQQNVCENTEKKTNTVIESFHFRFKPHRNNRLPVQKPPVLYYTGENRRKVCRYYWIIKIGFCFQFYDCVENKLHVLPGVHIFRPIFLFNFRWT